MPTDQAPTPPPHEAILFGSDPMERIVAIEPGEHNLTYWRRLSDGTVERQTAPFVPWILLLEPFAPLGEPVRELEGEGFRYLYEFPNWSAFQDARFRVRSEHLEHLTFTSASRMAQVRSGQTLFKGMAMTDVVRMQVDIETEGLSSAREEDRILLIAVSDNRGFGEVLGGDEPDLLNRLVELVSQRDPDIIEGHNILGFDLPFLVARAQRHNIRLALGRDGSAVRVGNTRNFAIGGNTRPFTPYYLYGRHVLDTYLALQRFDWAKGALSSYGLKEAARAFGISEADRVEIPRGELGDIFRQDPERVRTYALQDVLETQKLAELVAPTEFYQAQMVPDSFGSSAVSGTGDKINCLLIRAYLAHNHAIPRPQTPRPAAGGYTEIREVGVLDRVVKADVESLYPSIMLAERIHPASDTLGLFLPALAELTRRRLDAKGRVRTATGMERHYWDGLQNSFKVLINSFYGYLGAAPFNFNDFEAADRITSMGRSLVQRIADRLTETGSKVIEIDTDGVYFVPPESIQGEEAERDYVAHVGETLPQGIRLAFDGRFKVMVSLRTKNYVLYRYDGTKVFKGASLRSRADEAFGREFLATAIDLLIEHKLEDISRLYEKTIEDLLSHRVPIQKLARRERVTPKTFTSTAKQRAAALARDLPVGEYITVYERADGTLGLLEHYTPHDERTAYYMDKLYKFASRLKEAFGGSFDRLIPKPTAQGLAKQGTLDLF